MADRNVMSSLLRTWLVFLTVASATWGSSVSAADATKGKAHWAFTPPRRHPLPAVKETSWPLNPVDFFLLERMEAAEEKPSPEADRRTWLRRVSLDLIGLPPTEEELQSFSTDASPDAPERQIQRLLSSPHYGERLAMLWLDLVRYADTDGYHADNPRPVWLYRDYVISAFNQNLPFSDFTMHQLAGDLIPEAGYVERLGSSYNMLVKTTEESGANEREYLLRQAADRVRNVSSVWLGLTLGCAECHDHKSDPFTARDFYSFSAFFSDLKDKGVGKPAIALLPTPEQERALEKINVEIKSLNQEIAAAQRQLEPGMPAWIKHLRRLHKLGQLRWNEVEVVSLQAGPGQKFDSGPDRSFLVSGTETATDYRIEFRTHLEEVRAIRLEALRDPDVVLELQRQGIAHQFRVAELELQLLRPGQPPRLLPFRRAFAEVESSDGLAAQAIDGDNETAWGVGTRLSGPLTRATFTLVDPVPMPPDGHLRLTIRHDPNRSGTHLRHFRLRVSPVSLLLPEDGILPDTILDTLQKPESDWSNAERDEFKPYYFAREPKLRPLREKTRNLNERHETLLTQINSCVVSQTVPPRETRVLPRGNWMDESGESVEPALPVSLGPSGGVAAGAARLTRMDLAKWLVAQDNPLTARVFVNRLWRHFFGSGLVRSLNDFGVNGEVPSHPELLDSLAVEFMESGWNVKEMVSLLVTSRAYRQSSVGRPDLEVRDPDNRLFARQGRWRLEAELIRDQSLFAAGILVNNIGGALCYPYQPEGHWDQLDFPQRHYPTSSGLLQYRRGLYVFRQRTFPHPALTIFDAPSREECVAQRPQSNNPLQALALLNDPAQVECARIIASTAMSQDEPTLTNIAQAIFRLALNRPPTSDELSALLELYERQFARNLLPGAKPRDSITVSQFEVPANLPPETLAAWTTVARAVLNLHEFITRY